MNGEKLDENTEEEEPKRNDIHNDL